MYRKLKVVLPHVRLLRSVRRSSTVLPVESLDPIELSNEPILTYLPDSPELVELEKAIERITGEAEVVPIVVNGEEISCGKPRFQICPFDRKQVVAQYFYADEKHVAEAITAARTTRVKWDRTPLSKRIEIWNKAADLMATKYRADLVAATMMGQSKTIIQAEIDAAAELIDFTRMNAEFVKQVVEMQPLSPDPEDTVNHLRFRSLDGFVASISPFNFTAIGGNLAYTPALMGCGVLWKPSDSAILSNWLIFKIMREAGVPDGLVHFLPCDGPSFGKWVTGHRSLSAINFTGSVATFKTLWGQVAKNMHLYQNFPRLIGECGGKNFHFVHKSADVDTVVACTVRSAFEYSGQKCSACSRLYVPDKMWEEKIKKPLLHETERLTLGDVREYESFLSAVIDQNAFMRCADYIQIAKCDPECEVLVGGTVNCMKGWYVQPTIILVHDPNHQLMCEEIFGPILAVCLYKDREVNKVLSKISETARYALTGALFSTHKPFLKKAVEVLGDTAGNLYINDKSTGAIVGQQPFGGGRMSGTNDKAGAPFYLLRFTSPQTVKETFVPQHDIYYPYMNKS